MVEQNGRYTPKQNVPIIGGDINEKRAIPVPVFTPRELACVELSLKGFAQLIIDGMTFGSHEIDELMLAGAIDAHAKIYEALEIINESGVTK